MSPRRRRQQRTEPAPPKVKRRERRRSRGPARKTRSMRLLGLSFSVAGFAVIGLGWAGAASQDCVECQLPFLLSGGAVGLGLIVFGVGLLLLAHIRTEGRRIADRLAEVAAALASQTSGEAATKPTEVQSAGGTQEVAVAEQPATAPSSSG